MFVSMRLALCFAPCLLSLPASVLSAQTGGYPVVDTGQSHCFGDSGQIICPGPGQPFSGQDGQYQGNAPAYRDNGDGTVTDLVTGLMWQKTPDFKLHAFDDAASHAGSLRVGGHADWRVPTIKELFSLADFRGDMVIRRPYIDTRYFDFRYPGEAGVQAREIDGQYWSSTEYAGEFVDRRAAFGFNFADGRIKGYPVYRKKNFIRCVRGPAYGVNDFRDNGDGTVTDRATGLTWAKAGSGRAMNWEEALAYARSARTGGHGDWRLPNVKELQTIVDYSRAPKAKDPSRRGPAIDPVFTMTGPESWFWSSTTHLESGEGYYVCFGRGFSAQKGRDGDKIDIHGAGAVRADPKSGDPGRYANGRGPQSDEVRIKNYVRLVRGGAAAPVQGGNDPVRVGPPEHRAPGQGAPGGQGPGMRGGRQGMGMDGGRAPVGLPGYGPPSGLMPTPPGGSGQDARRGMGPPVGAAAGPGGARRIQGRDFMSDHDANGDGRVSRQEFLGPPSMFEKLDGNRDGYVDKDEAPKGPPR